MRARKPKERRTRVLGGGVAGVGGDWSEEAKGTENSGAWEGEWLGLVKMRAKKPKEVVRRVVGASGRRRGSRFLSWTCQEESQLSWFRLEGSWFV
ncbi:hypothetical protein E2C01_091194 [Portunus trituberculatus]|uniref:Uncharacterized protein n=1 Tax=Portunus trituberculatus TaxID=210409 RepID=A0A5B7JUD7_PORTR|nr:hypothetical protein [Portunus trituberculatus]